MWQLLLILVMLQLGPMYTFHVSVRSHLSGDSHTVDEFIEEMERVLRTRGFRPDGQVDFILSHSKGSALEEVKLCMGEEFKQPTICLHI